MVPVPILAFMHVGQVPVLARYITGTGIKWCPYWFWHLCIYVQYQYWLGTLPVLALNGARTGNVKEHYTKYQKKYSSAISVPPLWCISRTGNLRELVPCSLVQLW
jgi:hypothetical protein